MTDIACQKLNSEMCQYGCQKKCLGQQATFRVVENKFNGSKGEKTDSLNFPLYFSKFPLYNVSQF